MGSHITFAIAKILSQGKNIDKTSFIPYVSVIKKLISYLGFTDVFNSLFLPLQFLL